MRSSRDDSEYLYGINTITTLLEVNSGGRRVYGIYISAGRKKDRRIKKIQKLAAGKDINVSVVGDKEFRSLAGEEENTGNIAAEVSSYNQADLEHFLAGGPRPETKLVILDRVTDVGNFGSIIRNCRAFGVDGIITARKRSAPLNDRISRISAGALEGVRIFRVANISMAVRRLKSSGFWVYGTTLEEDTRVQDLSVTEFLFPVALVMGSEDRGISRVVKDNCDVLVSIGLTGDMQSLNVSVASGIILYHMQQMSGEKKR